MSQLTRWGILPCVLALLTGGALLSRVQAQGLSCPISGGNPSCGSGSTSQSSPNPSSGVGNPIDVTTGNKYQRETDIDMPGDLSIGFERHYNSLLGQPGVLGRGWSHTYETRLSRTEKPATGAAPGVHSSRSTEITLIQADGRIVTFQPFETTPTVRRYRSIPSGYGLIEEDLGAIAQLRSAIAAHRGMGVDQLAVWRWQWSDGRILTFNGRGLIETIERGDGRALRVRYDLERRLSRVTDGYGNWLEAAYWDSAPERLGNFESSAGPAPRSAGYRGRLKSLTLSSGERIQYQYDARGNLNEVAYADGSTRRYEYTARNGSDLLAKIFGRDGRLFASYEYDAGGHATGSSHPDHRDDVKVSYEWPGPKQPLGRTTVEDAAGAKTVYTWRAGDEPGSPFLLRADGPGCRSCAAGNVRYDYDANHRVTKTVRLDAAGAPIEQLITTIDDLGRTCAVEIAPIIDGRAQPAIWRETREYTGNSLWPTSIARPSVVPGHEHTLQVEYNERAQPTRITEKGYEFDEPRGLVLVSAGSANAVPLERVTTLTYVTTHGLSLLHSMDGPLPGTADTATYAYDAAGALVAIVHPTGVRERFERDAWGRISRHIGVDGVIDRFEYGGDSHITRFAHGDTWMSVRYDAAGQIAAIQDSLGQQLMLTRNGVGELVEIADVAGNRIHWNYGERGEVRDLTLLNPDGSLSQRGHSSGARIERADNALAIPNESMLSSIAGSLPDEAAAALAGLQSKQPLESASGASPTWNPHGLHDTPIAMRTLYDAERRATTYVYDDFGRLTAEHSGVSGTTRYRWDATDHLIERVAADDTVTRITRDALGRAIRVRAGPEDGRIEWGAANRPTRVTFAAGEERFEYDTQARLTRHELRVDGQQFRISYEFDALGRLSRKHLPDGSVLRYRYNGPLHPKPGILAAIYKEGIVDRAIVTDLNAPDERFADQGFTFGNGLEQRRVLDLDGRPLSAGNPKVGQSHLDWSRAGPSATYSRTASVGDSVVADSLPPWPARVAASVAEFGEGGSEPTKAGANPYFVQTSRFDVRGQLLEDAQRRYEWDALGRLTRVIRHEDSGLIRTGFPASSTGPGSRPPERTIAEYRYDLFGERIEKLTHDGQGTQRTYFLWDGTELAAEMDQSGKVLREYVYLDDRPVALLSGRAIYAIHTDHRMAPVAVTDSSRHVVWQAEVRDNGAAVVSPGSSIDMPLRASNQYFDAETGLHYNLYRYLDATAGRYLSPDPMGLAAGPDPYQFALGRPHIFVDPLGLQSTTNWSTASYNDKLVEIIKRTIPLVPPQIGAALQSLTQPATLASIAAIFATFTALQTTPIGWIADAALLGYSLWMIGSGLNVLIKTFLQLNTNVKAAKCDPDLTAAAQQLAAGFVSGGGQVAGGLVGVWGTTASGGITRIANGITSLVDYAKSALGISDETTVLLEGTAGEAPASPPIKQGLGGTTTQQATQVQWGKGIQAQGNPFENWVQSQLPKGTIQTPPAFPVVDHVDLSTGLITSTKTLDTTTSSILNNPAQIYTRLTGYINKLAGFPPTNGVTYDGFSLNASQVKARSLQLGIPSATNAAEWTQINAAIQYAKSLGIELTVTVIEP
jgi:RHS repeat-associated protein